MLLDLVQPFFLAEVSLELEEISIVSFTLQPVGLGLFTAPSPIVPSSHGLKPSIFKFFKHLASLSYATCSSATFFLAEVRLEL